jgi:hypoxanthine phosphoribosyltransferase
MNTSKIDVLFDDYTIKNRIQTLANFINEDYSDTSDVVLLCVLKGAINFFGDLSLLLDFDAEYEFVGLTSYEGTKSTGNIKLTTVLPDIKGKNVIIVEDIVDTGRSIEYLKKLIEADASDIKVCTLLDKPSRREVIIEPDYIAFQIEDHFVVGYGLDYNQKYRNLPYVGVARFE